MLWILPTALVLAGASSAALVALRRRRRLLVEAPLREMAAVARRLAGGDLSARFGVEGSPEARELAEGLNGAASALEARLERLKRLEQVRIDFVANVSHELRTPLTSIKGFAESLADGALEDPASARRFLEIIVRHTDRIIAVVDDLLTLSQMEAPEAPLVLAETDLAAVVEETAQGLEPRARAKGLRLLRELEPAPLRGDRARLGQVATNLLDNAIKYTPEGGEVRVALRREGDAWRLEVRDTGAGIEPWHLPRIFERFFRADRARSREMGGTGLGLAIVKHIVQAHGGSVCVESQAGLGSTFTVRLPA